MGYIPQTLHYADAAKLLAVHKRTLLRHLKIADAGVTPTVTVAAIKKVFGIDQNFLADYFAGHDRAVAPGEALEALGMGRDQRHALLWNGLHKPIAVWGKHGHAARRYSAKGLGLITPVPSKAVQRDAAFRESLGLSDEVAA